MTRLLAIAITCALVQSIDAQTTDATLQQLYERRQCFDLRDALAPVVRSDDPELLFFRGIAANAFHRPAESIAQLERYLALTKTTDLQRVSAVHETLADNYVKTFQYGKAADAYTTVLEMFGSELSADKVADLQNSTRLWGALRQVSPQAIEFDGGSRIASTREAVGVHIPVAINGRTVSMLIDTGANLSVASRSFATSFGFTIMDAQIQVLSITGGMVPAHVAVAPRLAIGNMRIANAVFLVFEDQDLYMAPIKFQIAGILGFPVLSAFRQITFAQNRDIIVPAMPNRTAEQNMCLSGLTPVIAGTFNGRRLAFVFDTGANRSSLWPPFYSAFEADVRSQGSAQPVDVLGAGGLKEIPGYRMQAVVITVDGRDARLSDVRVLTQPTNESSQFFHGNLGRDLIDQFEAMTINFESMSVVFE